MIVGDGLSWAYQDWWMQKNHAVMKTITCQNRNEKNENMGSSAHRWRSGLRECRYLVGLALPIVKNGKLQMARSQIKY